MITMLFTIESIKNRYRTILITVDPNPFPMTSQCLFFSTTPSWDVILVKMKWNESGFRPPLCTYWLNWARRTSWGWWDEWDGTALQTRDSKFKPWRSEAEHATSRSRRLPTILSVILVKLKIMFLKHVSIRHLQLYHSLSRPIRIVWATTCATTKTLSVCLIVYLVY